MIIRIKSTIRRDLHMLANDDARMVGRQLAAGVNVRVSTNFDRPTCTGLDVGVCVYMNPILDFNGPAIVSLINNHLVTDKHVTAKTSFIVMNDGAG